MSVTARLLANYHRSYLRGNDRLTRFPARRFKFLQESPVQTENSVLYVDLRISSSHGFAAIPKNDAGEALVIKKFVRKGGAVFDIGAHFGSYTLPLAAAVEKTGKVFAFELNPQLLPNLEKTLNRLPDVTLFSSGLSDHWKHRVRQCACRSRGKSRSVRRCY